MRKAQRELHEGVVEGAEILPEVVDREVIKLMKVTQITRSPNNITARIDLQTKEKLYDLSIDEMTAKAIHQVFVDFRKEHPDPQEALAVAQANAEKADLEEETTP